MSTHALSGRLLGLMAAMALIAVWSQRAHAAAEALYVTDSPNLAIQVFDGASYASWGTLGFNASLADPRAIAGGYDGYVYVSDYTNQAIYRYNRKFGPNNGGEFVGTVITGAAALAAVEGLTYGKDGYLYATSFANSTIAKIDPISGTVVDNDVTNNPTPPFWAMGVVFDGSGGMYVSYDGSQVVSKYDGASSTVLWSTYIGPGISRHLGIGADGNVYVQGPGGNVVQINADTGAVMNATFVSASNGSFGLAFDQFGDLYLTRPNLGDVYKFDGTTGALIGTVVDLPFSSGSTFGLTFVGLPEPASAVTMGLSAIVLLHRRRQARA